MLHLFCLLNLQNLTLSPMYSYTYSRLKKGEASCAVFFLRTIVPHVPFRNAAWKIRGLFILRNLIGQCHTFGGSLTTVGFVIILDSI